MDLCCQFMSESPREEKNPKRFGHTKSKVTTSLHNNKAETKENALKITNRISHQTRLSIWAKKVTWVISSNQVALKKVACPPVSIPKEQLPPNLPNPTLSNTRSYLLRNNNSSILKFSRSRSSCCLYHWPLNIWGIRLKRYLRPTIILSWCIPILVKKIQTLIEIWTSCLLLLKSVSGKNHSKMMSLLCYLETITKMEIIHKAFSYWKDSKKPN